LVEGTSSPLQSRYLARRDPATGWGAPWQVDPPLVTHRQFTVVERTTLAVSEDFSRALVVSNQKLTPDALPLDGTDGVDLYLRDTRSGAYTFVGGTTTPLGFSSFADLTSTTPFRGGSEDFDAVVFESPVPLTSDALPGETGIYHWTEATGLELISKFPGGSTATGVKRLLANTLVESVSDDGRRAVFETAGSAHDGLYLWEDGHTRAISVSHRAGDPDTVVPAALAGMSGDGRYVIFTANSADPLTDDAQPVTGNVYRLDLAGGGSGTLELLFDGPTSAALRISEDGSHVFLNGQLNPFDPGGYYVWGPEGVRRVSDAPPFILAVAMSPNGRYVAFDSTSQLTSFDNNSNSAGRACDPLVDPTCVARNEVYVYDYAKDEFHCASCPQDGSPSTGDAELTFFKLGDSNRYPRVVLDDGRTFFSTPSRLTAGDVNDRFDAYSFRDGRATLISPGTGPYSARFMDASADGKDVFIATTQPLSPRDLDGEYDYYDAREGSAGDPSPEPRASCAGDECAEPAGAAPAAPAVATQVNSGPHSKPKRAKHRKKHHKSKVRKASRHGKTSAHRAVDAHFPGHHGE
jgi:hypothetical protein